MLSYITDIDKAILLSLYNFISSHHYTFLDNVMIFLTHIGHRGLIWFVFAFVLFLNKQTRAAGIITVIALLIGMLAGDIILKNIVQRPRPYVDFPDYLILIEKLNSYSFPSGHTTLSFAAACAIGLHLKKCAVLCCILACLIAFSRAYLFMHYPTDIIGGIILGILCAKAAGYIYKKVTVLA